MKELKLVLLALISCVSAYAQKLPTTQQKSLRAPANIKVDGKTNDWGDKFEAYNPKAELFYSIANDDKRLYIIAQSPNSDVMNRMVNGGVKLIIQISGTESDKGAPFIKFPYLQKGQQVFLNFSKQQAIRTGGYSTVVVIPQPFSKLEEEKIVDSLAKTNNKLINEKLKLIFTSGLVGIDDAVPIYNESGIEAASTFNNKNVYTLEMAVDLKILGLSADRTPKVKYHIVINDEPNKYSITPIIFDTITGPDGKVFTEAQMQAENALMRTKMEIRTATTDFWGEYTLAK